MDYSTWQQNISSRQDKWDSRAHKKCESMKNNLERLLKESVEKGLTHFNDWTPGHYFYAPLDESCKSTLERDLGAKVSIGHIDKAPTLYPCTVTATMKLNKATMTPEIILKQYSEGCDSSLLG